MPYRMNPRVDCLLVKDQNGIIWTHYQRAVGSDRAARIGGPIIPWIGPEYLDRWLAMDLVTEIGAEPAAAPLPEPIELTPVANGELVDEAVRDLDRLNVPPDSGAPTCRKALRDSGVSYANELIAAAVKQRRARAVLSGTATA
jgi:cytochrome c oxidase cbb3-type subunit II